RRRYLRGGKAPRCSPRRAALPARCESSLPQSTAGVSDGECSSPLALPALYPARISVSSSLLAATMNQKSSLREDPQFVSWVLTGDSSVESFVPAEDTRGGTGANFVVEWAASGQITEPLIEAVMIGTTGTQGYSFTSRGKTMTTAEPR